jgi:hypothetical protein
VVNSNPLLVQLTLSGSKCHQKHVSRCRVIMLLCFMKSELDDELISNCCNTKVLQEHDIIVIAKACTLTLEFLVEMVVLSIVVKLYMLE